MGNTILFIFEGEKTEKQITDNLKKHFINENSVIQCAYRTDIYNLYKCISDDDDLDIFSLLKEKNKDVLFSYSSKDFAEIYLFFDYDGHATVANDKKIKKLLNFFNEETNNGKLFISYPMVEALKHFSDSIDFKELKVKAKKNIKYKNIVDKETDNKLKHLNKYTKEIWCKLIEFHLKKMNYITNNEYSLPTENSIQNEIFFKQLEKYINVDYTVAVLSSFPIFLFDYYGYNYIKGLLTK